MKLEIRKPWLGVRREDTGLLIVGESHYGSGAPGIAEVNQTTHVVGGIASGDRKHAVFPKVETVVTGAPSGLTGADSVWNQVAYFNFCPGYVPGPQDRPTEAMWTAGYAALPELLDEIKPRRILGLGAELWDNSPPIQDDILIRWARGVQLAGRLPIEGLPIKRVHQLPGCGIRLHGGSVRRNGTRSTWTSSPAFPDLCGSVVLAAVGGYGAIEHPGSRPATVEDRLQEPRRTTATWSQKTRQVAMIT